jgi:hypothetical protein
VDHGEVEAGIRDGAAHRAQGLPAPCEVHATSAWGRADQDTGRLLHAQPYLRLLRKESQGACVVVCGICRTFPAVAQYINKWVGGFLLGLGGGGRLGLGVRMRV